MSWRSAFPGRKFLRGGNEAAHFKKRQRMYRFDDKRRRRLLEDALVAELLDGTSVQQSAPLGGETAGRPPATTAAASRARTVQGHKSEA
jgi:hypothetical protein